ncbi:alpha-hydroxy-acid oxidizing protein [Maribius pontilimi]|uniref:Alpha-hydroxy-acid oxidizing protein n=1 Tax=Palleronia pontilimi TaxID=1964209 RepID=A0A934MC10_9RHOB|nr:alpha-hydroxy acid oxidase [Palleronia pontilimi]MBJ3762273.1 alpha-hydroxy-acid oxidizing protein [Palleronia pontilimi]
MSDLDDRFPALSDLAARARRRVPHFIWEYLDSATGNEAAAHRAEAALDAIALTPRALVKSTPDLATTLVGQRFDLPVGIAPVGMSGSVWPGAEAAMARSAARNCAPFCLSTVAAATPEEVGPHLGGGTGWFQLYAPADPEIRRDMLARARDAGFTGLILTVDLQATSRRERQRRARLTNPMRLTPRIAWQAALAPLWAAGTLRHGTPRLKTLEKYADPNSATGATAHIGYRLRTAPDWDYLRALRDEWDGALMVKGVLHPDDAARAARITDAVWVSNHGGRQFEAAPAPADALPAIRQAVGPDYPLIADGAVRSGTDVLRLLARGADFVMLGRAFHHGMAALGERGVDHVFHILREGLIADLGQLGLDRPTQARDLDA